MATKEVTISKSDIVLIAAAIIGVLIAALCLYALFFSPLRDSPFNKDKATAFKELFDLVVKGTLLPLFTLLVATKISYSVAKILLNKFSDR